MTIKQSYFGTHGGKQVNEFTLENAHGLKARVMNYGATLISMTAPGRDGTLADVVLGFDSLEQYVASDTFFGATCGRYGNRIKNGQFLLAGEQVQVTTNEAPNHLHGGDKGFDKEVWDAWVNEAQNSVTFTLASNDGAEGFPGNLVLTSTYTLTDDDRLIMTLTGTTDKTTILNMVNHSYWNMAGHAGGDLRNQLLQVESDFYTPVDEQLLATGEIHSVKGTPFDFRAEKPLGRDRDEIVNAGFGRLTEDGGGYDHNWIVRGFGTGLRPVATLRDPESGRAMRLSSTEPGVQIYAGGYLNPKVIGKGNQPYEKYGGTTFETQKPPCSPNFSHFPSAVLSPGEQYLHVIEVEFFTQ
ncbi:aldose epimerase family protein [Pseudomonas putida]|uniref:aldose epimerase family protein n=1 Tax=Pseudomonas putida TaxID=303 RepID=UPI00300F76AC